jgi:cell division protein FtsI/penicillin-binding protein 2
MTDDAIYKKINLISKIVLILFCIICFKVWHLGIFQKEKKITEATIPQRRTILQKANRGIICDRADIPMAINRIKYNATIYYSHIRQLPYVKYEKDKAGKKIKTYVRKEYIKKLSEILAKELDLEAERIEDIIYSKASFLPHIPYVIKENIDEKKYYKLKMLQRDWPGLYAEISQERHYPLNEIGADLLGYMGKISQKEYFNIANEIKILQTLIQKYNDKESLFNTYKFQNISEIENRLLELKKLSYNATDLVGKASIEKLYDEKLKGFHEKKTYVVDIKGNFLKELKGFKKPKNGSKLNLTISAPLQAFAEKLLIQDEQLREGQSKTYMQSKKKIQPQKQPWIKGGAIIAIDPNTSEVLVCASYPRFNPNDFITSSNLKDEKQKNINKWLETEFHIANIYDGKEKLSKEYFSNEFFKKEKELSYEFYLDLILAKDSPIKNILDKIHDIKTAIELQENVQTLLYFSKAKDVKTLFDAIFSKKDSENILQNLNKHKSYIAPLQKKIINLLSTIEDNRDKIFIVDLCRMMVYNLAFSDELIQKTSHLNLSDYWKLSKSILRIKAQLKHQIKPYFHKITFKDWRENNEKTFLLAKRLEEKEKNTYAHPYIDLLDEEENKQFNEFWENNSAVIITHLLKENVYDSQLLSYLELLDDLNKETLKNDIEYVKKELNDLDGISMLSFIKTIRSFNQLDRPLLYNYPRLRYTNEKKKLEKHLAASFYPLNGFGYSKSYAITNSSPPGSIFKIIVAYTALKENYKNLLKDNINPIALNPFTMIDDIFWDSKKDSSIIVGKSLDGKFYPRFYKRGRLPRSAHSGIGKINLIKALEKSSNPYFSILAGDFIDNPYNLINTAKDFNIGNKTGINLLGETKGNLPEDIIFNKTSLYSFAIGQHSLVVTPIQTAIMLSAIANKGKIFKPKLIRSDPTEIKNTLFMPNEIRNMILEGLDRVVSSNEGNARANIIIKLRHNPKLLEEYKNAYHQFVGKTSTAEFMYNPNINPSSKAQKYKNIWFGAISFEKPISNETKKQIWEKPELIVVVELNFGSSGKEAAPLAFQVIQKYKELKENNKI